MKKGLFLIGTLLHVVFANAQVWCGTDNILQKQFEANPELAATVFNQLQQLASNPQQPSRATQEVVYVPVVFHIIHNGDAIGTGENISEAQVLSQIDALNRDFNLLDPDTANVPSAFKSRIGFAGIKFCLAKFDPSGNPTSGIERLQYANATWDEDNVIDATLKPSTIWDRTKYLNIWSVRMGGTLASSGVLAYATLPFSATSTNDGIVARFNTIGTVGSLLNGAADGKTVSHEAGHWLGLLHIWGFGAGCGDSGDFIADTPDQDDLNFGCPTFPKVSCPASAPNGDMFMNHMDYSDDVCRNMFSVGQCTRMNDVLNSNRSSIKQSASKCFYSLDAAILDLLMPNDTVCATTFRPLVRLKNAGLTTLTSGSFYVSLDGGVPQIINWNGSLGAQESVLVTLPQQSVSQGTHNLSVTFSNPNGQSADNFTGNDLQESTFFAYSVGNAAGLPFMEDFESASFPGGSNWYSDNPNGDRTWVLETSLSAYDAGNNCVSIDNFSYPSNPNKKRDAVVTENYDFSNITYPELKFDVAYARLNNVRKDSLNVYYTLDCGTHWIKIWGQEGSALATAPDKTVKFVPTETQWKTVSVPILDVVQQNQVGFKFENVTGWGNMLYLDNINVQNNPGLSIAELKRADIKIYPNPASGMVAFRLPFNNTFENIELLNSLGEVVFTSIVEGHSVIVNIDNLNSGLYFARITGKDFTQTEKFFIQQ
jgi:hypothetical protein